MKTKIESEEETEKRILQEFLAKKTVGIKDAISHAGEIYKASEPGMGEPILNEQGEETGWFVNDPRLRVLRTKSRQRTIVTFKLH